MVGSPLPPAGNGDDGAKEIARQTADAKRGGHGKRIKVFCFFFSKKKTCFLLVFLEKKESILF